MRKLGFERFSVAGHDRGARVAYRMAFDHPDRVSKARGARHRAYVGGVQARRHGVRHDYFHWFFLAQPFDLPERLIGADPEFYWRRHTSREPKGADFFGVEALADYLRCFRNPATIHAICEDYRAGRDRRHGASTRPTARPAGRSGAAARAVGSEGPAEAGTTPSRSGATGPTMCAAARSIAATSCPRNGRRK